VCPTYYSSHTPRQGTSEERGNSTRRERGLRGIYVLSFVLDHHLPRLISSHQALFLLSRSLAANAPFYPSDAATVSRNRPSSNLRILTILLDTTALIPVFASLGHPPV
jgi:hypothetical protein